MTNPAIVYTTPNEQRKGRAKMRKADIVYTCTHSKDGEVRAATVSGVPFYERRHTLFLSVGRNYIEPQGKGLPERVAFVTRITSKYVYGFYWRFESTQKSGFRITLRNFFGRFVEVPLHVRFHQPHSIAWWSE